jgi:hypothetical protein
MVSEQCRNFQHDKKTLEIWPLSGLMVDSEQSMLDKIPATAIELATIKSDTYIQHRKTTYCVQLLFSLRPHICFEHVSFLSCGRNKRIADSPIAMILRYLLCYVKKQPLDSWSSSQSSQTRCLISE